MFIAQSNARIIAPRRLSAKSLYIICFIKLFLRRDLNGNNDFSFRSKLIHKLQWFIKTF